MNGRFQRLPIATKLRVIITTACIAVAFLTCAALALVEWRDVRTQMVRTLQARSQLISANASAAVVFNSPADAREILGALRSDRSSLGGTIFRPDGSVFAEYLPPGAESLPRAPTALPATVLTTQHATVWMPVQNPEGKEIGTIALRSSMAVLYARFRLYALSSFGVMIAAAFFAYLLSHRLQRLISDPLLALAAAADRVTTEKNFAVRVAPAADDEIGKLAAAFNSMLATIQAGEAESARLYDQVRSYATGLEARVKERTAQLQGAFEEMESFSYSVSHDLRGPLRHINGYAEMLLEDSKGSLTPDGVDQLERIIKAVRRMEGLINALLDFSRLTKKAPELEPVDITKMCEEVVADLRAEPANQQARVTVQPMSRCQADPVLLRQVLVNLLGNALKYSRKRQRPEITVSEVPVEGHGPDRTAYAIRDNGVGFDAQAAGQLFNVFVRLHDSSEFEGTGVGLATVKRIIQRHGGRIWAESSAGAGATFYFTLPHADEPRRAEPVPSAGRRAGR